jgi:hypothetical protein
VRERGGEGEGSEGEARGDGEGGGSEGEGSLGREGGSEGEGGERGGREMVEGRERGGPGKGIRSRYMQRETLKTTRKNLVITIILIDLLITGYNM